MAEQGGGVELSPLSLSGIVCKKCKFYGSKGGGGSTIYLDLIFFSLNVDIKECKLRMF